MVSTVFQQAWGGIWILMGGHGLDRDMDAWATLLNILPP